MDQSTKLWSNLGSLTIIAILGILFYIPVFSILARAFDGSQGFLDFFESSYFRARLGFTFYQALLSTIFSLLLGLPAAYFFTRFSFKGKLLLKTISTVSFVLPSILVILGFVLFFGNSGFINRGIMGLFSLDDPPLQILYSLTAIILAHAFYNFPVVMRIVGNSWEKIPSNIYYASRQLGASEFRTFFKVTLPLLMPGILASALLVFLFCFLSFSILLVLGGGPAFSNLEVEIYRLVSLQFDFQGASILAIYEIAIALGLLLLYHRYRKKGKFTLLTGSSAKLPRSKLSYWIAIPFMVLILFITLGPLSSVVIWAFSQRSSLAGDLEPSIRAFQKVFSQGFGIKAVGNSLFIAFSSTLISLNLGFLIAYLQHRLKGPMQKISYLLSSAPLAVSGVILGLAYLVLSRNISNATPLLLLIFIHAIIMLPFVVNSISADLHSHSDHFLFASLSLGASPLRSFFLVELPLLKRGILVAAIFGFSLSLGEINAALILSPPNFQTIPLAMYRYISSYDFFSAAALGTSLLLVTIVSFYLLERLGNRNES
jgi:thiamine transport system permease protein